ncbi:MAG: hypothetical protein ABSH20_30595 [Tepidisphaeraceae bacterium]
MAIALDHPDEAQPGQVAQFFVDYVLKALSKYSNPPYHPVVRVNAMLALGELNGRAATLGGAAPLPGALPILLATVQDKQQLDGIRIVALEGLVRHAGYQAPGSPTANKVNSLFWTIAKTADEPGRSADGQTWARALAIEGLGIMRNPGPNGEIAKLLGMIAGDANVPTLVRIAAARALGNLNYQDVKNLRAGELAAQLAQLAIDITERELTRDAAAVGPRLAVPPRGGGHGPVVPPIAGKAEPEDPNADFRNRLLPGLSAVGVGLYGGGYTPSRYTGLHALAAGTSDADLVGRLVAPIQAEVKALADRSERKLPLDELKQLVAKKHQDIMALMKTAAKTG